MAEKKSKKKKGGGKIILVLILLLIIAAVLLYLFGDGLGFGFGGGFGDGDSVAVNATVTAEQTAESTAEENQAVIVEITEDRIIFDGTEYATYEEFEKFFYENDFNGCEFVLKDNKAVKSVYDSVKALLDSFGGNYSEEIV